MGGKKGNKDRKPLVIDEEQIRALNVGKVPHKRPSLVKLAAADREYLMGMWMVFAEPIEENMYVGPVDTKSKTYRYTPRQMWNNVRKYFEYSIEHGQPLTLSGIAAFNGMQAIDLFHSVRTHPEGYGFLNSCREFIIMYNEFAAHKKQNPAGPIFLLKNLGMKDKFEIEASTTMGALTEAERAEAQKRIAEFSERSNMNDALIEASLKKPGKVINL